MNTCRLTGIHAPINEFHKSNEVHWSASMTLEWANKEKAVSLTRMILTAGKNEQIKLNEISKFACNTAQKLLKCFETLK